MGGSASTSGSVVAPSFEDSLESSDSGVASGTSSRSRGGSRISERGGESDSGKGHAPPARGWGAL